MLALLIGKVFLASDTVGSRNSSDNIRTLTSCLSVPSFMLATFSETLSLQSGSPKYMLHLLYPPKEESFCLTTLKKKLFNGLALDILESWVFSRTNHCNQRDETLIVQAWIVLLLY